MKKIILTAVVSVGLFAVIHAVGAADLKEGQWSIDISIQVPGMEGQMAEAQKAMEGMSAEDKAMMESMMGGGMGMMGSDMGMKTTTTQCITNENPVPESENDTNCKSTHTRDGQTINFDTKCDNSHSTGTVTYADETMTGTIQSTSMQEGQQYNSTINITGKYVGPCV